MAESMRVQISDAGEVPKGDPRREERLPNVPRSQVEAAAQGKDFSCRHTAAEQRRSGASTLWQNLCKAWRVRYPTAILSFRCKLLYYPVPKAASSSVKRLIAKVEGKPYVGIPQHEIDFDLVWGAQAEQFSAFTSFTVVRNPWDRFLSCYLDKIRGRSQDPVYSGRPDIHEGFLRYNQIIGLELFHADMSFYEFATAVSWIPDYLADEHFRSQHRMFCAPNGRSLARRIIRFEELHAGIAPLFRDVEGGKISLEFSNRTRHSNYRDFYDAATRKIVSRRYRRDIERLGYQF